MPSADQTSPITGLLARWSAARANLARMLSISRSSRTSEPFPVDSASAVCANIAGYGSATSIAEYLPRSAATRDARYAVRVVDASANAEGEPEACLHALGGRAALAFDLENATIAAREPEPTPLCPQVKVTVRLVRCRGRTLSARDGFHEAILNLQGTLTTDPGGPIRRPASPKGTLGAKRTFHRGLDSARKSRHSIEVSIPVEDVMACSGAESY